MHRFSKFEGDGFLFVDVLIGRDPRHAEIIANADVSKSARGIVRVARAEDLIWMKQKRNSLQDEADIKKLQDDKD